MAEYTMKALLSRTCYATAVALALLSTSGCAHDVRSNDEWRNVQTMFDRAEKFEMDFRVAALTLAGKSDAEKLEFARDVMKKKFHLHFDLQDEIKRTTEGLASRPDPVRASYQAYLRERADRLKATQSASEPSAEGLRLEKYNDELKLYAAQLAREPRRP